MFHINKLGGTTIGNSKYFINFLDIISKQKSINNKPSFVVSAINSQTKEKGTTNKLIQLFNDWPKYKKYNWEQIKYSNGPICDLINDHTNLEDKLNLQNLSEKLLSEKFEFLKNYQSPCINQFVSIGELLSANILNNYLKYHSINSTVVDLTTSLNNNSYDISKHNHRNRIVKDLKEYLTDISNYDKRIPIFTGFLGVGGIGGTFKIFNRGYSDATSSIIAGSLNGNLTVWKDSGGVFSGHPFKLTNTKLLEDITLNESKELTSFGNEVLHPSTSLFIEENKLKVDIGDIRTPIENNTNINLIQINKRLVSAIAVKENISIILLKFNPNSDIISIISKLSQINCYIISINKNNMSIAIDAVNTQYVSANLGEYGNLKVLNNKAIISCIGDGMKHQLGTASLIFNQLSLLRVNIEMISQGPEEINISVVIENNDLWKTVQKLHNLLID